MFISRPLNARGRLEQPSALVVRRSRAPAASSGHPPPAPGTLAEAALGRWRPPDEGRPHQEAALGGGRGPLWAVLQAQEAQFTSPRELFAQER